MSECYIEERHEGKKKRATRRSPWYEDGSLSYLPIICSSVKSQHANCVYPYDDSNICMYAHNNTEIMYHPIVYKTQLC